MINPDEEQLKKWTEGNCEKLRYEYDLNENSICLDLGAFHCEWSLKISEMYNNPKIYAFEATPSIFEIGSESIKNNSNIKLFNYGVGGKNEICKINIGPAQGVSTSLFVVTDNQVDVNIRSISEVFNEIDIEFVDLMKINIEGSEYDVLESLIEHNLHTKIKNLQIQFHRIGENYESRYFNIQEKLSKSHKVTYQFSYIWENWSLCQ
jgi:FkbM family methyltransferase